MKVDLWKRVKGRLLNCGDKHIAIGSRRWISRRRLCIHHSNGCAKIISLSLFRLPMINLKGRWDEWTPYCILPRFAEFSFASTMCIRLLSQHKTLGHRESHNNLWSFTSSWLRFPLYHSHLKLQNRRWSRRNCIGSGLQCRETLLIVLFW